MGNVHEFDKAINWILAGHPIVCVQKQYVERIERVLRIRLKRLSNNKYLVIRL